MNLCSSTDISDVAAGVPMWPVGNGMMIVFEQKDDWRSSNDSVLVLCAFHDVGSAPAFSSDV